MDIFTGTVSTCLAVLLLYAVIAANRARRMQQAIEELVGCWREYQAGGMSEDLRNRMNNCVQEVRADLSTVDEGIIRPNRRTAQDWRDAEREMNLLLSRAEGSTEEALSMLWDAMMRNPNDPGHRRFENMIESIAEVGRNVSVRSYF